MPGESADPAGTKVAERQAGPLEQDSGGGVQARGQWQLPDIGPQRKRGGHKSAFSALLHFGRMWSAFLQGRLHSSEFSSSKGASVHGYTQSPSRRQHLSDMAVLSMHYPTLQAGETDQEEGDWEVSPLTVMSSVVFLQKTGTEGV